VCKRPATARLIIREDSANFSESSLRKWEPLSLDKPEFLRGNVGAARGRQIHSARKRNEKTKKTNQENKTPKKSVGIPNRNDPVVTINVRWVRKAGVVTVEARPTSPLF
jgi:hypothetical protein